MHTQRRDDVYGWVFVKQLVNVLKGYNTQTEKLVNARNIE